MQTKMKLNGGQWGGLREGAGRKRIHSAGVAHQTREKVTYRNPLHINFRYSENVRNKETLKILKKAILNARRHGLKILNYSFQSNHIHLIIEATDNKILTKGMRSLTVTFAKLVKRGRIQVERYHLHVLKTVRKTKHAIHYVLFNQQKHESGTCSTIDGYTSLMSLKEAMVLIKNFAIEKKMVLKIEKAGVWEGDEAESFLYNMGLAALTRPGENLFS